MNTIKNAFVTAIKYISNRGLSSPSYRSIISLDSMGKKAAA